MVRRLWGKCDGQDIVLTRNRDSGRWETTVPASANQTYIFELWAEDYAGNVGYFATIKVSFDSSQLCAKIYILDVGEAFSEDEVRQALRLVPVAEEIIRCEVCGQ